MSKASQQKELPLDLGDGRDELNLAEFPLSLISKSAASQDQKGVLIFEDEVKDDESGLVVPRRVTISGSADTGLPTSADEEVLLALIQLTKAQGFENKKVYFSRYQLLKVLGWEDTGYYYNRLRNAFEVWLGVTVKWKNAWKDYSRKAAWGDKGIVLIQDYELKRQNARDIDSHFTWADKFFESFQSGNLKGLDFNVYRTLKSQISKRMFRFLDKQFQFQKEVVLDLAVFAYEKVGMRKTYKLANIKQQFEKSLEELEEVGFLKPIAKENRYRKKGKGVWDIYFHRGFDNREGEFDFYEVESVPALENALVKQGVTRQRAKSIVAKYPEDYIERKMDELAFLIERGGEGKPKNPAGFLVKSILEEYAPPVGYQTPEERAQKEAKRKKTTRRTQKEKKEEKKESAAEQKREAEKRKRVADYLAKLSPHKRPAVIKDALAKANDAERVLLGKKSKIAEWTRQELIERHVLELL